jgi:hypothetical protein
MHLDKYSCVLCNSGPEETSFHLFFECPFSLACWNSNNVHWDFTLQPLDMIVHVTPRIQNCLYGLAPHVERACIRAAPLLYFRPRFV